MASSFGGYYFLQGLSLIFKPGVRRYTFIPILLNVVLYVFLGWWLWSELQSIIHGWIESMAGGWSWLAYVLYPFIWIGMALFMLYTFVAMSLVVASPFFGFLAEALQKRWQGQALRPMTITKMLLLVPRSMKRELGKLLSFMPWVLLILLCYLIPGVNVFTGLLWIVFFFMDGRGAINRLCV